MENRDSTLQKLFTLRAGLSSISELRDNVQAIHNQINSNLSKIEDCKSTIAKLESRTRSSYGVYTDGSFQEIEASIGSCRSDISRLEKSIARDDNEKKLDIANMHERALRGALAEVKELKEKEKELAAKGEKRKPAEMRADLQRALQRGGVNQAIKYVAEDLCNTDCKALDRLYGKINDNYQHDEKIYAKINKVRADYVSKCREKLLKGDVEKNLEVYLLHMRIIQSSYRFRLDKDNKNMAEYQEKLAANLRRLDLATGNSQNCREQITAYQEKNAAFKALAQNKIAMANKVYDVLIREFNDFLPASHWQNLDMIIYYIQERYADTVKEALNLYLQQLQNDRIVNSISAMEDRIVSTINTGIQSLQNTLVTGFTLMSKQLTEIQAQQRQTATALQYLDSKIGSLDSSINFNNSLLLKANATSQLLADDMHYMRRLATDAEARRKVGL